MQSNIIMEMRKLFEVSTKKKKKKKKKIKKKKHTPFLDFQISK